VDTNVAALGEYHLGNYENEKFLYITLSTGMGGGYIIDGKVYAALTVTILKWGTRPLISGAGTPKKCNANAVA